MIGEALPALFGSLVAEKVSTVEVDGFWPCGVGSVSAGMMLIGH